MQAVTIHLALDLFTKYPLCPVDQGSVEYSVYFKPQAF